MKNLSPALGNWFKEGNLSALREIALREVAHEVDEDVAAADRCPGAGGQRERLDGDRDERRVAQLDDPGQAVDLEQAGEVE